MTTLTSWYYSAPIWSGTSGLMKSDGTQSLSQHMRPSESLRWYRCCYRRLCRAWKDVPRGTMDEVSSYVRLDLPLV
jgi:hypothetical protein